MINVLRPDEIAKILREQIENSNQGVMVQNRGTVLQVGDGIARVYGLDQVMSGELVKFEDETIGIALNLENDNVGVVLMDRGLDILEGSAVYATGKIAQVPVGEGILGRIVNPLAIPIDGKGDIAADESRLVEFMAPGIISRKSVCEPMQTGITAIDAMIPIGRGQRELIIGDRQTGKTAIALDTIINRKTEDVVCVYVAIGQKASSVAQAVTTLEEKDALSYTVIVSACANDPQHYNILHLILVQQLQSTSCIKVKPLLLFMMICQNKHKHTDKCRYYYVVHQVVKLIQVMFFIYILDY